MSLFNNMSARDLIELSAVIDGMLKPTNEAIGASNKLIAELNEVLGGVATDKSVAALETRIKVLEDAAAQPVQVIIDRANLVKAVKP
jgi:hypothetical protein